MQALRSILPIMFAFILFAGMLSPTFAQTAYFRVDPTITNVHVGDTFEVRIYINGLDATNPMIEFRFIITWDNALMRFAGHSVHLPSGWTSLIHGGDGYYVQGDPYTSYFTLYAAGSPTSDTSWYWETFTFECLRAGSSPLNLPSAVTDEDGSTTYGETIHGLPSAYWVDDPDEGAVNQIEPRRPSTPYHVGGELFNANKLAVLAPYLALISIVAVAAIFAKRRLT